MKTNSEKLYGMNLYDLMCKINTSLDNDNCIIKILSSSSNNKCVLDEDGNCLCNKCIQEWFNKKE